LRFLENDSREHEDHLVNRSVAELVSITEYIEEDDPGSAERLTSNIFGQAVSLSVMPRRGKPGRLAGTREIYILPWPYFVVYRVIRNEVHILHIRHTARKWPPRP